MKNIILILFLFFGTIINAQNIKYQATDAFGINCNIADTRIEQKQGDIHYTPIYNRGLSLFYTYSYYLNEKNYFSFTVAPGLNFLKENILLPADKYKLDWDYVNPVNRYIPSLSLYLSYTHVFKQTQKSSFYFTISPGVVSAVGYNNNKATFGMPNLDSLAIMIDKYKHALNPVLNFELGVKRKLRNGNFINFSINPQYSFFNKYENENEFFPTEPQFYSVSSIKTNLSFIGLKISYEIKEKKKK